MIGLDLRQVENVIDQAQQVLDRAVDLVELLQLTGFGKLAAQQVGEAQGRIHRRANLVAHVGEKHALGAVRGFGALPRLLGFRGTRLDQLLQVVAISAQLPLIGAPLGDVANKEIETPVARTRPRRDHFHGNLAAIGMTVNGLEVLGTAPVLNGSQTRLDPAARFGGAQLPYAAANQLPMGQTGHPAVGAVDFENAATTIGSQEAVRRALNSGPILLFLFQQLAFGAQVFGDVVPDDRQVQTALQAQGTDPNSDVPQTAVLAASLALELLATGAAQGVDLVTNGRFVHLALDIGQAQACKFFPGVAKLAGGTVVELDKVQVLRIHQHHGFHRPGNDGAKHRQAIAGLLGLPLALEHTLQALGHPGEQHLLFRQELRHLPPLIDVGVDDFDYAPTHRRHLEGRAERLPRTAVVAYLDPQTIPGDPYRGQPRILQTFAQAAGDCLQHRTRLAVGIFGEMEDIVETALLLESLPQLVLRLAQGRDIPGHPENPLQFTRRVEHRHL